MKLSVLMSVYAKEKPEYLERALDSILLNQSRKPDEVLLVCDGPLTPGLNNVVEKYANRYNTLRLLKLKDNMGLGKALQYGLQETKYDLVARMDTDDVSLEDRFEKQLRFMAENPHVSVCGGHIVEFDSNIRDVVGRKMMETDPAALIEYAKKRNPINHTSAMFRKKHVLEVGGYKQLLYAEDYYLWVRLLVEGYTILNMDEILVYVQGGKDMYERRSHPEYSKSMAELYNYMYSNGFITFTRHLVQTLIMKVFINLPPTIKGMIYKKLLRS